MMCMCVGFGGQLCEFQEWNSAPNLHFYHQAILQLHLSFGARVSHCLGTYQVG